MNTITGYAVFKDGWWVVDSDTRTLLSSKATLFPELKAQAIAQKIGGKATFMEKGEQVEIDV